MASPNDFLLQTVTGTETSPETHTGKQVFNMCTHFKPWDVVHMQKADDRFIILLMFTFTGHEDSNGGKSCHCQVLQNAYMEEEDAYNFICHVNNSFNKSGKLTLRPRSNISRIIETVIRCILINWVIVCTTFCSVGASDADTWPGDISSVFDVWWVTHDQSGPLSITYPAIGFLCASVGIKSTYVDCRNNPTNRQRNMPIIGLCVVNMIKEGERACTMFMYTAFFWIKTCIVKKCVRTWMLSRCKQILMWGFFLGGGDLHGYNL